MRAKIIISHDVEMGVDLRRLCGWTMVGERNCMLPMLVEKEADYSFITGSICGVVVIELLLITVKWHRYCDFNAKRRFTIHQHY